MRFVSWRRSIPTIAFFQRTRQTAVLVRASRFPFRPKKSALPMDGRRDSQDNERNPPARPPLFFSRLHRSPFMPRHAAFAFTFFLLAAASLSAADWPQWRGPHRDGIGNEKNLLDDWTKTKPKLVWNSKD